MNTNTIDRTDLEIARPDLKVNEVAKSLENLRRCDKSDKNRPKVGLALGSGFTKGLAHLGVIKALLENDIPIDYVTGSSSGAIVGAIFCSKEKWTVEEWNDVIKRIQSFKNRDVFDPSISSLLMNKSLIKGDKLSKTIQSFVNFKRIEDLPVPLGVTATNLNTLEKTMFSQGDLNERLKASYALTPIFPKVTIDGIPYGDGGPSVRMPAKEVKEMGADFVIGSDVGLRNDKKDIPNALWFYKIQELKCFRESIKSCNMLFQPYSSKNPFLLNSSKQFIEEGYNTVQDQLTNYYIIEKMKKI